MKHLHLAMYEFIIFIPLSIIMSPSSTMFFLTLSQASIFHELLTTHSYQLSADFYVNCSILCNIEYHFQRWCPYTCAMSQRLLFQALALFSDSFNEVYSTPFLLVTTLTVFSCYFIFFKPQEGYKSLSCMHLFIYSFISKNPSSSESLNIYTADFPHQCIYTLQNVLQDDSFYFVCI